MAHSYDEMVKVVSEEIAAIKLGEISAAEVTEQHSLWSHGVEPKLQFDSLDIFELVYRIEARTGHTFAGFDLMTVGTVGELVRHVMPGPGGVVQPGTD